MTIPVRRSFAGLRLCPSSRARTSFGALVVTGFWVVGRRSQQKEAYVSSSVIFLLVLKDHMKHGTTFSHARAHTHCAKLFLSLFLSLPTTPSVYLPAKLPVEHSFWPVVSLYEFVCRLRHTLNSPSDPCLFFIYDTLCASCDSEIASEVAIYSC